MTCTQRIWFIQPAVGGHLGCFYFLAVVRDAAMNIGIGVSVEPLFSILLGIYLGAALLDHGVILRLTLWGTAKHFYSSYTVVHSPQRCRNVPISPYPLQHLRLTNFFDYRDPRRCDVVSHCGFRLSACLCFHFVVTKWDEHLFLRLPIVCVSSLEKWPFTSFSLFKIRLFFFVAEL